ncbi:MAG: hypothetical protein AAGD32_13745 [Planctomycetota bacterium]
MPKTPPKWDPDPHHVKPDGGFALLHGGAICAAWDLGRTDIGHHATRLYFALVEMSTRRAGQGGELKVDEALNLMGLSRSSKNLAKIRRAYAALSDAKLIVAGDRKLSFPDVRTSPRLAKVPRGDRRVPVPRRVLRLLAKATTARTAAVLGYAFRCLHNHRKSLTRWGLVQVQWIADVFDLNRGSVDRAKQWLVGLGWIKQLPTHGWLVRRHGVRTLIDLRWGGSAARPGVDELPLARRFTKRHPLPRGSNNQQPAGRRRPGVSKPPTWRKLTDGDLRDLGRLRELFAQRDSSGAVYANPRFRDFVALAVRARDGDRPAALFRWLIDRGRRDWVTQSQEDEAIRWLKPARKQTMDPPLLGTKLPRLEIDPIDYRLFVAAVKTAGCRAFQVLRDHRGWTRERFQAVERAAG